MFDMPEKLTREHAKDTGMAMVFICMLVVYCGGSSWFLVTAMVLCFVNMLRPGVFLPLSRVWFGLAAILGGVMSKVILTLVFYGIVTPVGLLRRLLGKDTMRTAEWGKAVTSTFLTRNHCFQKEDVETPY